MKRRAKVSKGKIWLTLGFAALMTIMITTQLFAAVPCDDEECWLSYMREEEKLARDVYLALYDIWDLAIFKNISDSEQKHMDSIKTLLDRYGVPDPAEDKAAGEFTTKFQSIYDDLIEVGSTSVTAALKVGELIELTDIEDLTDALADTDRKDIKRVYTNLRNGSYNHLDAFRFELKRQ